MLVRIVVRLSRSGHSSQQARQSPAILFLVLLSSAREAELPDDEHCDD
jgi:hypothetical protein